MHYISHGQCAKVGDPYTELLVLVMDTGTFVNNVNVVGENGIAGVLRNDTKGDDDGQTPAVSLCLEEIRVSDGAVSQLVKAHRLFDLLELVLHGCVVLVASSVVGGEHVKRLIGAILGDQVSWGFRDPYVCKLARPEYGFILGLLTVDEHELDGRGNDLNEGDCSPGPVIVDSRRSPSDAGHHQGAQVPQTIVDGSHGSTVLGMADFSQEEGRAHLRQAVAETEDEAAGDEHCRLFLVTGMSYELSGSHLLP
jgi:hypothetical protein